MEGVTAGQSLAFWPSGEEHDPDRPALRPAVGPCRSPVPRDARVRRRRAPRCALRLCPGHNDFEIASARLALSKSGNQNPAPPQCWSTTTLPPSIWAKSRSEAGVSHALTPGDVAVLCRLSGLEGPQFDAAYANAQLAAVATPAQYGARRPARASRCAAMRRAVSEIRVSRTRAAAGSAALPHS